jgi:hypothetical protein
VLHHQEVEVLKGKRLVELQRLVKKLVLHHQEAEVLKGKRLVELQRLVKKLVLHHQEAEVLKGMNHPKEMGTLGVEEIEKPRREAIAMHQTNHHRGDKPNIPHLLNLR